MKHEPLRDMAATVITGAVLITTTGPRLDLGKVLLYVPVYLLTRRLLRLLPPVLLAVGQGVFQQRPATVSLRLAGWGTVLSVIVALLMPVVLQGHEGYTGRRALHSLSNLKQIGAALLMYVQDHEGRLPPMGDMADAEPALFPYVKYGPVFFDVQAGHKTPFQPNPSLSGRKIGGLEKDADQLVAFYGAFSPAIQRRPVLFVDGSVRMIPEAEWRRVRQASRIP